MLYSKHLISYFCCQILMDSVIGILASLLINNIAMDSIDSKGHELALNEDEVLLGTVSHNEAVTKRAPFCKQRFKRLCH